MLGSKFSEFFDRRESNLIKLTEFTPTNDNKKGRVVRTRKIRVELNTLRVFDFRLFHLFERKRQL